MILGTDNQLFILHGALLRSKEVFDWNQKKNQGKCDIKHHIDLWYGLKDQFGNTLVSNLNCTNDTEAVLASNSETMQVYLKKNTDSKITGNRDGKYIKWRETSEHFLAPKEDESDEVVENSVSYNPKMYWLKGKPNKDGFFTLAHPKSGKLLTYGTPGYINS